VLGIVDLSQNQNVIELGRERRLARILRDQRDAGAGALDLEAEREAGNRALGAVIDPAGFGLLRAPGIGRDLGLRGRIEPEAAPGGCKDQEEDGSNEEPPTGAPACGNGHIGHAATL
jgi:hypothetical protein